VKPTERPDWSSIRLLSDVFYGRFFDNCKSRPKILVSFFRGKRYALIA
jgi:hypothetical protein